MCQERLSSAWGSEWEEKFPTRNQTSGCTACTSGFQTSTINGVEGILSQEMNVKTCLEWVKPTPQQKESKATLWEHFCSPGPSREVQAPCSSPSVHPNKAAGLREGLKLLSPVLGSREPLTWLEMLKWLARQGPFSQVTSMAAPVGRGLQTTATYPNAWPMI